MHEPDGASRKPEDSKYTVDVLTRCIVNRDGVAKKNIKIVPLKDPGEPLVVSVSISEVSFSLFFVYCFSFFKSCVEIP